MSFCMSQNNCETDHPLVRYPIVENNVKRMQRREGYIIIIILGCQKTFEASTLSTIGGYPIDHEVVICC